MRLTTILSIATAVLAFPVLPGFSLGNNCLIKLSPEKFEWVSEEKKMEYKRNNVNFIDVTASLGKQEKIDIHDAASKGMLLTPDTSFLSSLSLLGSKQLTEVTPVKEYSYPKEISYKEKVQEFIDKIDTDKMYNNLAKFSSFYTRYYKTQTGYDSAEWLELQIKELTTDTDVEIKRIIHDWKQFSIVVSIPGEESTKVVVGAHQDSANLILPTINRAPGADDDGSGTVTILEVFRILMEEYKLGSFKPHHTLEFHWYSAEEGGLLGSYDVYKKYAEAKEEVVALLQQDMTGFTGNMEPDDIHMGLIEDYTTPGLNDFVKLIIDNYCAIPYHGTQCGYACSDHASALEHGYPASFVIESEMSLTSKFIHSSLDTIDRIDWAHVTEHAKLTVGFAYEMSLAKF